MIMNYYRNIDRSKIQFDFLVQGNQKGAYEDEIIKLGGKIHRVKRIKYYAPWIFEEEVYKFLKQHQEYKIVHSHINALSKYVLRAAKRAKVPNRIAHSHNIISKNSNLKNICKNFVKIGLNKYSTKRFACSQDAGKWLYGKGEFEVLPNAIDVDKFRYDENKRLQYRKNLDLKEDEIIYYNVGRIVEQKNQSFLIDIFYEIQKSQKAKLVIIGDGELKDKLLSKVKKLGIEDKVIFTGVRKDINDLINAMDIFIFPSLYEGLGIVLIEAQTNGLMSFVSDMIPNEAIITNNTKVLSLKNDANYWSDYIIKHEEVKRENHIKEIVNAGYDIKESTNKLQKYYLKINSNDEV